jgi:hypothetical protein
MNATALCFPTGGFVTWLREPTRPALTGGAVQVNVPLLLFPAGGLVAWLWESPRRALTGERQLR